MTQRVVCFHLGVCRRVSRVAYSDADVAGRKYVVHLASKGISLLRNYARAGWRMHRCSGSGAGC